MIIYIRWIAKNNLFALFIGYLNKEMLTNY